MRRGVAAVVGLALASLGATPEQEKAPQPLTIVIGGSRPRLSIASCDPAGGDAPSRAACAAITEVLRDDVEFEGLFELSPAGGDLEAALRATAEGRRLVVEATVRAGGSVLLARSYPGQVESPWSTAHHIADDLTALTQYRGVATSRIAFVSDRDTGGSRSKDIYFVDYDGREPFRYSRGGVMNILPAWSPDGQSLAFVAFAPLPDVLVVPLKGERINLTRGKGESFSPAWSPDGEQVAFASSRTGEMEIWLADRHGGHERQLTAGAIGASAPCWSPAGCDIAFTSARTGAPQIWVIDADGLNLRKLPAPGPYHDAPAWNPAKEYSEIAYASRVEGGRLQVSVLTLPDGPVRAISDPSRSCESPSWAPNGRHLVFACQTRDGWQLLITDRDGRIQRTLTSGKNNDTQPDWGP